MTIPDMDQDDLEAAYHLAERLAWWYVWTTTVLLCALVAILPRIIG